VEEQYHRVFGGSRIDMALSALGHEQAQSLPRWFGASRIDAVYASPMLRVQQTIAPLLAQRGLQPTVIPDLREVDFGDWTGFTWGEVKERFGFSAFDWLEVMEGNKIPNGESAEVLLRRVEPSLSRILRENPHRSVAVACHGGIIRVILALLLEWPLSRMAHFNIEYGSVTVVELQPEKKHAVEIELLNFCPWRDSLR